MEEDGGGRGLKGLIEGVWVGVGVEGYWVMFIYKIIIVACNWGRVSVLEMILLVDL